MHKSPKQNRGARHVIGIPKQREFVIEWLKDSVYQNKR